MQVPISHSTNTRLQAAVEASVFAVCMMCFSVTAVYPFPEKLLAIFPLTTGALLMSRYLILHEKIGKHKLNIRVSPALMRWCSIGILAGLFGGLFYRGNHHMPLVPAYITPFAGYALLIAVTEELVFRGYLQARLSLFHSFWAVLFAAMGHSCYKAGLFMSPAAVQQQDMLLFMLFTLAASSVAGWLRQLSGNLLPAILAHVVFDLVVYAEVMNAPWWVW